jgi:hypothetical protein
MRFAVRYATVTLGLSSALSPADLLGQREPFVHPIEDIAHPREFDFWLGEWEVQVRRRQEDGSWADQEKGSAHIYSILDGNAVLELWNGHASNPSGYAFRGFSLRHYDPDSARWVLALNWPSPDRPNFYQLTGSFRHGRGEFFVSYRDTAGVDNLVRYTFSDITPVSLRWDGGISRDGGKTWASSMIFEFTRTRDRAHWPGPGEPAPTYHDGSLCNGERFSELDFLQGGWEGTFTPAADGTGRGRAEMTAHRVLDGCAHMSLLAYETAEGRREVFEIRSYLPQRGEWVELWLDDRPESAMQMLAGDFEDGNLVLTEFAPRGGELPPRLSRIRWLAMEEDRAVFELGESRDAGAMWRAIGRVELRRDR